ncbi:hypothetical protein IGS75_01430 [Gluconobacter sphaericus]|uniref:hypothetical protein n=1 Tax=Gluconobacter sphaericus TaxID=574987 RepID=UPI001920930D|nr:hypothetical protein [Gluconobacter sphaericus]QQX91332.1 hypothetical protein IGS75_01430 [Gluconobacter sphaericus]
MSASLNGAPGSAGYLVSDLIGMALEQLGVGVGGQNADPQGLTSGVMHLNMLLAQWQRKRWLVPNLIDRAFMSTGQSVYYVGPGGDLDIPLRPDKIEAAYARLLNGATQSTEGDFSRSDFDNEFMLGNDGLDSGVQPIDYPLELIQSYEDYSGLGLKALRSWPNYAYYNPAFPMGEFRPWPIPSEAIWEFHLIFKAPLPANLTLTDPVNLPPEYWDAIMWSLAARLSPSYGQPANPTVTAAMKAALSTLRASSTQVPTLGMPSILSPINNPFYWPGLEIQRL